MDFNISKVFEPESQEIKQEATLTDSEIQIKIEHCQAQIQRQTAEIEKFEQEEEPVFRQRFEEMLPEAVQKYEEQLRQQLDSAIEERKKPAQDGIRSAQEEILKLESLKAEREGEQKK